MIRMGHQHSTFFLLDFVGDVNLYWFLSQLMISREKLTTFFFLLLFIKSTLYPCLQGILLFFARLRKSCLAMLSVAQQKPIDIFNFLEATRLHFTLGKTRPKSYE